MELLERYQVRQCYFAHLHGPSIRLAVEGERNGTRFSLISADRLNFVPKRILDF
ncbi:MAG: hypothetical protein LUG64_03990 [Clostridiales bacterium]|nr:hypothetical protein [Clostridiales bacterium]